MTGRTRILGALLAAAVVGGGGLLLEGWLGPREFGPAAAERDLSGAWFCPHGGGDGWRAWIALANPTEDDVEVVVTTYSEGVPPTEARTSLLPGTESLVEVPAVRMASGSVVEFFGAAPSAGMIATRPEGGQAAEPCSPRSGKRWYLAEGTSERGQQAWLVVLNPYAIDATFDVLPTGKEPIAQAGDLRGVLLPPRQAAAIDLNRFALGKKTLAATIRASAGKVVVAGLGLGESGIRSVLATPAPARSWFLPGAADDGPSAVNIFAPDEDVPVGATVQGSESQADAGLGEATVPAGLADTFEVLALQSGLVVATKGTGMFVAGRRLSLSTAADQAATGGVSRGARGWISPPALGPGGGQSLLILQNVGAQATSARVSLLTEEGRAEPAELAALVVEPGLTRVVDLTETSGGRPVTAVVETDGGTLVVAQASVTSAGYAIAVGLRLDQV
jgi:uncharacterized protein DUF5719